MDALNRSRNNLIAGAVLIFFALAYYSLIYRYGLNLADEGNVALISQRLMCGERPFHDVSLGYNVLWFYPVSILFKLFGTNLLLMRAYFYALSTASGLIAFALFRRLDSPLWLAYIQGLLVISITGPYFKAYIPLLILANLFALTLFLTSLRKRLVGIASGILLGTTYLIRIDLGFFFSAIWCGVVALHALLLDRRVGLNLLVAANLIIGTVAVHLPFIYDAYNRDFLRPFLGQYAEVGAMILRPLLPRKSPSMTNRYRPSEFKPVSDAQTLTDESKRSATERSATGLRRRSFKDILRNIFALLPNAPLAQLAEQVTLNHWVVGSIPTRCMPQRERLTKASDSATLPCSHVSYTF
jgi:hypothetical protein